MTEIYSPLINKIVAKMFGENDREDAFQAIWLALLAKNIAGQHNPEMGPLEHLVYVTAKNVGLDLKRALERHSRLSKGMQESMAVHAATEVAPTETGMVFPEFQGTPAHQAQQATVLQALLEGYNQKEIADREGFTTTWSNKVVNAVRAAALGVPRVAKDFKPQVSR
jgi:DNA-directed RNA polymerase specialized sigma24 family protein